MPTLRLLLAAMLVPVFLTGCNKPPKTKPAAPPPAQAQAEIPPSKLYGR